MPYKMGKVIAHSLLLWVIGFVWGTIVFMVPTLKNISSIPYISQYPAISVPLIITYIILLIFLSRSYLKAAGNKISEGLKYGVALVVVNLILDLIVYIVLFKSTDYFEYASIYIAYAFFILIPVLSGHAVKREA